MAEERIHLVIDSTQAKNSLNKVEVDAKTTEQMVKQVAINSQRQMAITRQQAVSMAMQSWSMTRQSMALMGITLSQGFSAMVNVAMQSVQLISSLAMIYTAQGPTGWAQATLLWASAGMAGMALLSTLASQRDAMAEFARTGNVLRQVKSDMESEYYL